MHDRLYKKQEHVNSNDVVQTERFGTNVKIPADVWWENLEPNAAIGTDLFFVQLDDSNKPAEMQCESFPKS